MALDSNVMTDQSGPLRHFTPYPTPSSSGVNIFAQAVEDEVNPYVFPPFALICPLLKYLQERKVAACTVVLPVERLRPVWWPIVMSCLLDQVTLGRKGDSGKLYYPTKKGWIKDMHGLNFDLVAFRLQFAGP
jgi:hypothetical protein